MQYRSTTWNRQHQERHRYSEYKSNARRFVELAKTDDLLKLLKKIKNELKGRHLNARQ